MKIKNQHSRKKRGDYALLTERNEAFADGIDTNLESTSQLGKGFVCGTAAIRWADLTAEQSSG